MAADAMDIDVNPAQIGSADLERKRKSKHKDHSSPSKKRKHLLADEAKTSEKHKKKSSSTDKSNHASTSAATTSHSAQSESPFSLTTATLYLPLSPISISPTHALASLLAEHLSPLLLTYYPPLKGVVLAYSNPSISSKPPTPASSTAGSSQDPTNPSFRPLTLATTANEYGVLYVYLTATFLVFRPQRGQTLEGWVNVQSEGFLGAVVFNLFSVGIERKRLPASWQWVPPGEEEQESSNSGNLQNNTKTKNKKIVFSSTSTDEDEEGDETTASFDPEKEHFRPVSLASDGNPLSETLLSSSSTAAEGGGVNTHDDDDNDDESSATGYFRSVSGHRVRGLVRFRVVDVDIIPGSERDHAFLSIEGTMLSPDEEAKVVEDERNGVVVHRVDARFTMSGGLTTAAAAVATGDGDDEQQAATLQVEEEIATTASPAVLSKKEKSKKKDKDEKKKSKSKSKTKEA